MRSPGSQSELARRSSVLPTSELGGTGKNSMQYRRPTFDTDIFRSEIYASNQAKPTPISNAVFNPR
jgi:hypothetical protein